MKTALKSIESQLRIPEPHRVRKQSLVTVILVLSALLILAGVISLPRFFLILAMVFETLGKLFEELSRLLP